MKRPAAFCLLLLWVIAGCDYLQKPKQTLQQKQRELEKGSINEKNIYTVKELGWTAKLPANWEVVSKRQRYDIAKSGRKTIEETYGTKINGVDIIPLVALQKDAFNIFYSAMEPLGKMTEEDYDQHIMVVHGMIKEVYESKKVFAKYVSGAVRIDGIMFDRFETTIYSPDKKKVIAQQKLFTAPVNGFLLTMTLNFNNEKDGQTMTGIVLNSKFSIKE